VKAYFFPLANHSLQILSERRSVGLHPIPTGLTGYLKATILKNAGGVAA
jgi:hypothetical protein